MKWMEVEVTTSPEHEDYISDVLYQMGAKGLDIEDPNDIIDMVEEENNSDWDFIDEKLLDLNREEMVIKAYYSEEEDLDSIKKYILERIEKIPYMQEGKRYGIVSFSMIDEENWSESWKEHFSTLSIGKNIIVKPSWEEYNDENKIIIELDPGMAFGTGTHETTMMCGEALEEYVKSGDLVYDIGTGSGILSIIAAKLGADKVIGVDIDSAAVKIANKNVLNNKVEDKINILQGDLLSVVDDRADLIVSNIIAEIISEMTEDLKDFLKKDGIFIASGIILDKISMVEDSLEKNGFKILEVRNMNEWACIIAKKIRS